MNQEFDSKDNVMYIKKSNQ